MQTQTYNVKGMHCASCSSVIEKTLKKIDGVHFVEVNYGTEKAKISFDSSKISFQDISKYIGPLGYSFECIEALDDAGVSENKYNASSGRNQVKKEKLDEVANMRTKLFSAIPIALISIIFMMWKIAPQFTSVPMMSPVVSNFMQHLLPIFATYILFVVGKPYLLGFYRFLRN